MINKIFCEYYTARCEVKRMAVSYNSLWKLLYETDRSVEPGWNQLEYTCQDGKGRIGFS